MEQKNTKTAFIACVILFIAALVLSLVFSGQDSTDLHGTGGGQVVLSEILPSNRTCPSPEGTYLDYIEVYNGTASAVDISGYMLSDAPDSIGYTFPQGTVLPSGGRTVVWCDKNDNTGKKAAFGISKDGGETVYLYNSANVVIDQKDIPRTDANVAHVRLADGSWSTSQQPTPGYENSDTGFAAWLSAMGADSISIRISEVMTGSDCLAMDASGKVSDWVELWNTGSTAVTLDGAFLSDDPGDLTKWRIPSLTIQPGQRALIRCVGTGAQDGEADFALPRDGCTVTLTGPLGNVLDSVTVPNMGRDISWSLQADDSWLADSQATPGYENNVDGYAAWLSAMDISPVDIVISEVMPANQSTILSATGELCDWVELWNRGDSPVILDGAYLSNDAMERGKWQITYLTLEPGERMVIRCAGVFAAAGEADFSLSRDGCTVTLSGPAGNLIQQLTVPALEQDRTWALQEDSTYQATHLATPGYSNDEEGRSQFLAQRSPLGALVISEVMPSNSQYLRQSDGKCYDWVELRNASDAPIDLSNYFLSDDADDRQKFRLPQRTLQPGERIIVICCGSAELTGSYIYAPFTLSREESWLYVTDAGGSYSDYLRIFDVPYQASVGRADSGNTVYYFTNPTPGTANGAGVAFISATPTVLTEAGVYNDVDSVTVALSGAGELRYTTDGSAPTSWSALYTEPLVLTKTTVLRFASFEDGKLPSDTVTASYIINENHTLPVISLTLDGADFSDLYNNYYSGREVQCNMSFFEDGGSFTIDGGLEMSGRMGLELPKKSFKINFRGSYGDSYLSYPVFGEDAPQIYDGLVIRAGQDYTKTIFREQLFTSLCADATDSVLVQRDKFCVLYVNGSYYGIYCLKEAFTELYYAQNMGVREESVTVTKSPIESGSEILEVMEYCRTHDLREEEHYQYVAARLDIDSLIDWMIMEAYCGNSDVKYNIRYYKSTDDDGKFRLAFFDLDWAWYYDIGFKVLFNQEKNWQFLDLTKNLVVNPTFRQRLLERMHYHMNNTLTEEVVLAKIQYYEDLLTPEVPRDRARWQGSLAAWQADVDQLRSHAEGTALWDNLWSTLDAYIHLTDEEWATYAGR